MVRPDSQWEPPTELGFLREPLIRDPVWWAVAAIDPWLAGHRTLIVVALVGGVVVGASAWSDDRAAGGDTKAPGTVSSCRNPGPHQCVGRPWRRRRVDGC